MNRFFFLSLALFAGAAHAVGPDGGLDNDFGTNGHSIAAFDTDTMLGGIAPGGTNRAMLIGTRPQNDSQTQILFARLFTNTGLPDLGFGDANGARATELPAGLRGPAVYAVTVQPNGRFLVAGTVDTGTDVDSAFVCRFFAVGNLDANFAANGCRTIRTFLPGEETCRARGVTVDANDNVVVSGYCDGADAFARPFLARLTSTGAYDVSFFGGVFTPLVSELGYTDEQYFQSVVVTPAGKIAVAVTARHSAGDTDVGVVQFNADGTFDTAFSGNGQQMFVLDLGTTTTTRGDHAGDLLVRPSGRLLLAARARTVNFDGKVVLVSLNADGSGDTTFGTNGIAIDPNDLSEAFLFSGDLIHKPLRSVIDRFGRIVITTFENGLQGDSNDVVRRYLANGSADARFGNGGTVSIDHQIGLGGPLRTADYAAGLVFSAGRIIVASLAYRPSDNLEQMLAYAIEDSDLFQNGFE